MHAVVIREPGPPEVMRVEEVPAPEPADGEITIDVAFAGVGFVDMLIARSWRKRK